MKSLAVVVLFLFSSPLLSVEGGYQLTRDQWSQTPHNTETVVALPGLSRAMQDFQATSDARLRLYHPGGNSGSLWAAELRAWLITLGVPSTDLEMVAGSTDIDTIELEVIAGDDKTTPVMTILPDEPVDR